MRENTQQGNKTWRVFCAVPLPLDLRERLMAHVNHVRDSVPDSRASLAACTRGLKTSLRMKVLPGTIVLFIRILPLLGCGSRDMREHSLLRTKSWSSMLRKSRFQNC